jgi:hypothetical protein
LIGVIHSCGLASLKLVVLSLFIMPLVVDQADTKEGKAEQIGKTLAPTKLVG